MSLTQSLAIKANSTRAKVLEDVNPDDFRWAVPVMRLGYAGRALVYLVVAGFSLWSIAHGGDAEGTQGVMETLRGDGWFVLVLIAVGMFSYALWRLIDSIWDLEAYGTDGKGTIARLGMIVTGVIHLGIGVAALGALFGGSSGSEGGTKDKMITSLMQSPGGMWILGAIGVATIGAGIYYIHKAVTESYRSDLKANHFTRNWNGILKIGVIAQGAVVGVIGLLIVYAALRADPSQAGGLGTAFDWLSSQIYGQVLVTAMCVGLLAFAVFCLINALYRIVPKAADDDVVSLAVQ